MRTTALRAISLCTAAVLGLLASARADAQSGTRLTPEGKRALVSKDIGGQRWAISRNPDRSVTGNVFFPGGGAPQFVFCSEAGSTGDDVTLSCSGANACPLADCQPDEWTFIADVTLPLAFFGAPIGGVASTASTPTLPKPPLKPIALVRPSGVAGSSASGLQVTPDRVLTLISKDVGEQRWAITRNDDGTVTGNVFFPGGGEPQFVWCEPNGTAGATVPLRCLGAAACTGGTACSAADWTLIAAVELPASFFEPRRDVSIDDLTAAVVAALGDDAGFQAIALAIDAGYALRQIARAALGERLRPAGQIVTAGGGVEAPQGTPLGLLELPDGSAEPARALGGRPRITPQLLEKAFEEQGLGGFVVALILGLLDNGYSLEQIVAEVFFFQGELILDLDNKTISIRDERGNLVEPDGPPQGVLKPRSPLDTCGNGRLDGSENCDGLLFSNGATCGSLGLGNGALRCSPGCGLDTSGCRVGCGNGVIEPPGERCDGSDLGGATCKSLTFGGGELGCSFGCDFDTRSCVPPACGAAGGPCCGPGTKACGETCIAADADCCDGGAAYCESGSVCVDGGCCPRALPKSCGDRCIAAGASCCGNGTKEAGEECDGADLGGASCEAGGSVTCSGACTLDRSGCRLSCEPPAFECGSGCAPGGADCCGAIGYCDPGKVCTGPGNDSCCPSDKPELCGDRCMPASDVCCGTYSCSAGDVCAGGAGSPACCPAAYPVFCGRQCFAPGSVCCGDGACVPGAVCREGLCGPP